MKVPSRVQWDNRITVLLTQNKKKTGEEKGSGLYLDNATALLLNVSRTSGNPQTGKEIDVSANPQ